MNRRSRARPSQLVLMALVARKHYLQGQSKSAIAEQLGLSRFQVARLLDGALAAGVVRIEVGIPGDVELGLSAELRELFSLQHAIVVDVPEEPEQELLGRLGSAIVQLLNEVVGDRDVVGLATSRAVLALGDRVPAFPGCPVVQLNGALSRPDATDVIQAIRSLTRVGGGPAHVFYAPLVAADVAAHESYRRQPDVVRTFAMLPQVAVAVLGVGAWRPGLSTVHDAVGPEDRRTATADGVVAEVAGLLIDGSGQAVRTPLADRVLAPTDAELRRVPLRIGVVFGPAKADAVRAAVGGGLVNGLVTHRSMAERLLNG
jgi:DNA-binding transcriptional regulator LsrR (DeoR family)